MTVILDILIILDLTPWNQEKNYLEFWIIYLVIDFN